MTDQRTTDQRTADQTANDHDAVVDVLTDAAPPGSHDHERRHPDESD